MAHVEEASVEFLICNPLYESEKPFQVFLDSELENKGVRETNLEWESRSVSVHDFRGNNDFTNIDEHGFTSQRLAGFDTLNAEDDIANRYIPAVKHLLMRALTGVGTVYVYDWRIRDSQTDYPSGFVDFKNQNERLLPSNFAHVDMTPISLVHRIQRSFPEDAERMFEQRIRAVNVWKPLDNPVDQWALALCDGNTIPPSSLIETDSIRRDRHTSLYYATFSEEQKWYFLHRQSPEEVLIFKHFDSDANVKAARTMHSSIKHHDIPVNAKPRRSIEVRTLIFEKHFEVSDEVNGTE